MSSSVSSKHAFSQDGITITKSRNWLKGDIIEALQCIKCAIVAICHDLLFQEPAPSSLIEAGLGDGRSKGDSSDGEISEIGWDKKLIDDSDECDNNIELVLSS